MDNGQAMDIITEYISNKPVTREKLIEAMLTAIYVMNKYKDISNIINNVKSDTSGSFAITKI